MAQKWILGVIGTLTSSLILWMAVTLASIKTDLELVKQTVEHTKQVLNERTENLDKQDEILTVKYNDMLVVQTRHGKRLVQIETLLGMNENEQNN
ncbi:MAG: hypothetical protein ACOCW8_01375 [bacterium]